MVELPCGLGNNSIAKNGDDSVEDSCQSCEYFIHDFDRHAFQLAGIARPDIQCARLVAAHYAGGDGPGAGSLAVTVD
jgi:hypothetical protein